MSNSKKVEETKKTILNQKSSQRDAFFTRVYEMMKEDQDIVVITCDQGAPIFDKLRKDYANRFFNVGIAEQNGVLIGSGLAKEGKKVFVYAIASFMVLRAYEIIRISNSVMNYPVTIVGVGAGYSYDDSGPTHHLFEDVAVMRVLPNFTIHNVTDNILARKFAEQSVEMTTPNYVRLERHVESDLYENNEDISNGFKVVKEGSDILILTMGIMVRQSLIVSQSLENNGVKAAVADIHTIKCNEEELIKLISKYKKIVTIEEHFLPGGLGSYIAEILADSNIFVNLKRFGIKDEWIYRYGGREDNREFHGLDAKNLEKNIASFIKD